MTGIEKTKEVQLVEKNRCPKCNSSFGYIRLKTKEWICRNCGNVNPEAVI